MVGKKSTPLFCPKTVPENTPFATVEIAPMRPKLVDVPYVPEKI